MIITKQGFTSIVPDNELAYYRHVQAAIESIDPDSTLLLNKGVANISIRLSPSHPKFINDLISVLNNIHNALSLRVTYSKSMKTSCTINYQINLEGM